LITNRFIYKIEGPSAELNFPLTPEQRAELDGLSLAQVDAQFREEGKQGEGLQVVDLSQLLPVRTSGIPDFCPKPLMICMHFGCIMRS
jgi:hypothetical protein